ncbi:hypothetical protein [Alternaria tenuissima negative-stranded RNA virus 2]|nr:hypothetical protein [Alternaria tenuissima negative-stranded RNA virus 2]
MSSSDNMDTSANDDCVYSRELVQEMLSNSELTRGIIPTEEDIAMSGALPAETPKATIASPEKTSPRKETPLVPTHRRTLSTDSEKALYNLEFRTELLKLKSDVTSLQDIVEKQGKLLSRINQQTDDTRELLEKLLKIHNTDIAGVRSTIDAYQADTRKRIDDTLQIHQQTPIMVERLVSKTNELMSFLPEERKAELKAVKLQPQERQTIEAVRKRTEVSKKQIPKHMREFM